MTTRYSKIVVPLDGSPFAEHILSHLPRLATPANTEMVLIQVLEAWRYALGSTDFSMPSLLTQLQESAATYLDQLRQPLEGQGYTVSTQVVMGEAAQSILDAAETEAADLIAMTTHGRAGFVRWALGSVAERVLQRSVCPVLLVREPISAADGSLQQILTPLDGSAFAEQALPDAQVLAQANGASLLLIQALQQPSAGNQRLLFDSEADANALFARWRAAAEAYLMGIAANLKAKGIACTYRVVWGDPDQAILDTIEDEKIDLIVMTTHGRTGMQRWFYGSVANRVMRGASCPLLLVRNLRQQEDA